MKKYTVFIALLIFLSFLLCGCTKKRKTLNDLETIKERGYIIVGVKEDTPPFGFYRKNKLTGIDIDLAKIIANNIFESKSEDHIEFVPVTVQNRISKLNSKEVDILVATMSINDKRKLVIDFSAPYFIANQKLMVKKNSKITHLQYFNTHGILAVVLGSTGEKLIKFIAPNARIVGVKNYAEAVKLLSKNQVDGVLGDDCILNGFINKNLKIINKSYSKEFYGVALRKSESSKELLSIVNVSVANFLDEKKINILRK